MCTFFALVAMLNGGTFLSSNRKRYVSREFVLLKRETIQAILASEVFKKVITFMCVNIKQQILISYGLTWENPYKIRVYVDSSICFCSLPHSLLPVELNVGCSSFSPCWETQQNLVLPSVLTTTIALLNILFWMWQDWFNEKDESCFSFRNNHYHSSAGH